MSDLLIVAWAALVAGACLALASLVGHLVVPPRWRSFDPCVAALQEVSAGMTAISLLAWLTGALLGTRAVGWVVGALVLGALPVVPSWVRCCRVVLRRIWGIAKEYPLAASFLAVPALWSLPALLLPVVDSDGLRYHLALPKLFLLEGAVFLYPWDVSGAYPQGAEMLYLLCLQAGSAEAAKWLHCAVVAFAVIAAVLMVGRRNGGGPLAGLAYAASPAVLAGAAAAFIDGFAVFHVAVAALTLKRRGPSGAVGLALAGAAWTKWTVAPAVVGCLVMVLFQTEPGKRIRSVVIAVLPIALVLTPLLARNVVELGDPVFPMLTGVIAGEVPGVDPEMLDTVAQRHRDISGPLGIPWGRLVGEVEVDEIVGWHHLLALIALPLLMGDRRAKIAASLVVPYLLVGLVFHPSIRLALPLIWGLAVVTGVGLQRMRLSWSLLILCVATLPLLASSGREARSVILPYLRGEIDRAGVVDRLVPGAAAARFVNEQKGGGRVMALDFPAPFLFDRPWVVEGLVNYPPLRLWMDAADSVDDLYDALATHDVHWIVVTPGYGGGRLEALLPLARTESETRLLLGLRKRFDLVYRQDNVDVWRVRNPGD